jgi:hypothetical protein
VRDEEPSADARLSSCLCRVLAGPDAITENPAIAPIAGWNSRTAINSPGYQSVVLTLLLHGVGKIGQRGGAPLVALSAGVANSILGSRAGHARWSAGAFDEIIL